MLSAKTLCLTALNLATLLSPAFADVVRMAGADQLVTDAGILGVTANAMAAPVDPVGAGQWSGVIQWTPHIPVSAANLPDGRILTWAGEQRRSFDVSDSRFTYAAVWDPATGRFSELNNDRHDMFCGGTAMLPDGRVFVNGGDGCNSATSTFDWRTNRWTALGAMNDIRWYNPSIALPDGGVFTVTGNTGERTAERWDAATSWRRLPGIDWISVLNEPGYVQRWHPFIVLAPNGRLFHFGPTDTMRWITPTGTGSMESSGQFVPGDHYPKEGAYAMYEEGRILVCGGAASPNPGFEASTGTSTTLAYTVDLTGATPVIRSENPMRFARQFANAVVLPNGEVLVIGGNDGTKFSDRNSVLTPELWNPRTRTWRTVANLSVPRNYHSIALLLADGRVLCGGGGLGGGDHQDAQIYTPPALLTASGTPASRPVISGGASTIGYGQNFNITATPGVAQFAFIRISSVTHSVNTDLRRLVLPFTETSSGNYTLTSHPNANVMTPGYWMLFAVDPNGVYSQARTLLVTTANSPSLTSPGEQQATVGSAVNLSVSSTVPTGVGTFSAAGLPPGLSINAATGNITGVPSVAGVYRPTLTLNAGGQFSSATFNWTVLLANLGTGTISREVFSDIGGLNISDLTNNGAYPGNPSSRGTLTRFEAPENAGENYGQRIRGILHAPVTGRYRFYLAADDSGQLLLSTDATAARATVVASTTVATFPLEWNRFPSQTSVEITLEAGQRYYIEALAKEGGGGDHLAVAWSLPGLSSIAVIPGAYLSPFQAAPALPTITSPGGQQGTVGTPVNLAIASVVPTGTPAFSAAGLPPGLSINPATAAITGTPTTAGTYQPTLTLTAGGQTVSTSFTWTVLLSNPGTGTILREFWSGIGGDTLDALVNNPNFPGQPTGSEQRTSFQAPTNVADAYGQRMRGYVFAPVTGTYRFYISSDDNGRLLLSSDDTPGRAVPIASVPGFSEPLQWDRFPEQASVAITLQAGQRYYIEALSKEGGGGDHLAVGWTIPGSTAIAVIPGAFLAPFQVTQVQLTITSPGNQQGTVGTPVNLSIASSASAGTPAFSAAGLPPGLSINPSTGAITGNPTAAGSYQPTLTISALGQSRSTSFSWIVLLSNPGSGTILREFWNGIGGETLAALTGNANFPGQPTGSELRTSFQAPTNVGENYGQRMRGYVYAPVTGTYRFYISSDDNGRLLLSSDETVARAVPIASVPGFSEPLQWDRFPEQASAAITLQAGQRYYIEALSKEGFGGDHLAVGWTIPGSTAIAVIPGAYLAPFTNRQTVARELYNDISGVSLDALTSNPNFPGRPTTAGTLADFEAPTNLLDNYGQRLRSWVTAPVTGQYRFYISSDDAGRLSLSTDASSENARAIATCPFAVEPRAWTVNPQQASALITLQAGQRYYIEALSKEGAGGDHLAVGWTIPGTTGIRLLTSEYLSLPQPPSVASPGTLAHVVGESVSTVLQTRAGANGELTLTATGLPPGLAVVPGSSSIAGRPTQSGSFAVTATVQEAGGLSASVSFTWTIRDALTLPTLTGTPLLSGTNVALTITGSGGTNARYTWNFGDGTPDSAWSSSGDVQHTFPGPGRYLVTVTAQDDTGRILTSSFWQVIHAPLTAAKPTASSALALVPQANGNARLWVVNPDADSVTVLDAVTGARLAEIAVPAGPRCIAQGPDGRLWVTSIEAGTLSVLNPATLAVDQSFNAPRGTRPFGVAFSPNGSAGWLVLEATGQLLRFNPANGTTTATVDIGPNPRHLSVTADGTRVLVSRFITPPVPGESTAVVETTGRGGEVVVVDAASATVTRTAILQHSEQTESQASARGIPNYLGAATISPDGLSAWIPSKQDNIKRGQLRERTALTHDGTLRAIASKLDLPSVTENYRARVDIDNSGMPSAAAFDPFGGYLFVALEANREVAIIDVWNATRIAHFSVGRAPQALVVSPDGTRLYVQNFMDRTVSIYDVSIFRNGRVALPTLLATVSTVASEKLSGRVLRGKQLFYDAADRRLALEGYISCASCHNDGGHDGRTWDFTGFGEGLRNTPTLRGHGNTLPAHWSGNFDEIQDFENQIRNFAGGSGLIENGAANPPLGAPNAGRSEDLDALAAYVNSLTTHGPSPFGVESAEAEAGRRVFVQQNCASCHSGSQLTNSALGVLADIGTIKASSGRRLGQPLTGFDTPTLRGLWGTAPYLHDGSAATLEGAIAAHRGVTVSETERRNLASFLRTLGDGVPAPVNSAPTITVPVAQTTVVGTAVNLAIRGSDADGQTVRYTASGLPAGLSIDVVSGVISGTVGVEAARNNEVTVSVSDGLLSRSGSFGWTVLPASTLGVEWTSQEIGGGAVAGGASFGGGVYTLRSAGLGVVLGGDQFQYVWQQWSGDGELVARVTSQTATDPAARAGLIFRESLSGTSRFGAVFLTPSRGYVHEFRQVSGGPTGFTLAARNAAPNNWLRLIRSGDTVTSFRSVDGVTWTQIASGRVVMSRGLTAGLIVSSKAAGQVSTATMDNVRFTPSTVPAPWVGGDIGAPARTELESFANGVFTVRGGGAGITGTADHGHFTSQVLSGNGQITARVVSQSNTFTWAKAGVMIRESVASNARMALATVTQGQGVFFQARTSVGGAATAVAAPRGNTWVRLVRNGNTITAWRSGDGVTWTALGTTQIAFGPTVSFGLAVTASGANLLSTAVFDNVTVTPLP